jgi:hypothetical protein
MKSTHSTPNTNLDTGHATRYIKYGSKNSTGKAADPLESRWLPDGLGLNIIRNLAESIEYRRVGEKNRVRILMKRGNPAPEN